MCSPSQIGEYGMSAESLDSFGEGQKLYILRCSLGFTDIEEFSITTGLDSEHLKAVEAEIETLTKDDYDQLFYKWPWAMKHVF